MTARPAHPGTSTGLVRGHDAPPDAVTADPDLALALALARWENEGGVPDVRSQTMQRQQPRVRVGRVYDERAAADEARVLVDRLWPRGLTKVRADLDEWCKQIAPSAALRTWYGHDPDRFAEFARRYRTELDDPERADTLEHLRGLARQRTLTLLTATRRAETSEAAVLADLLDAEPGSG